MIAMLLAAGRGKRLRPLTDSIPKALVEVQGTSLLERHLQALAGAGIKTCVINLGWHGEQILSRIGSGTAYGLNVIYSPEGDDVLETGGGVHRALPVLGADPFLVVNADVYTDMPYPDKLGDDVDGHLVLVKTPDFKPRGDFDLVDSRIVNSDAPSMTFSGIALYRPEFFRDCKPGRFPLAPILRAAADARRLSGEFYEGTWEDVGTRERLQRVNRKGAAAHRRR